MSAERTPRFRDPRSEPLVLRVLLCGLAFGFLALFLIVPLAAVFTQAFAKGWDLYLAAIREPNAAAAIRLTLLVTAIVVPLNTLFGLAAAWAISHFRFRGRPLLVTLVDLPFSVSPVVSGKPSSMFPDVYDPAPIWPLSIRNGPS